MQASTNALFYPAMARIGGASSVSRHEAEYYGHDQMRPTSTRQKTSAPSHRSITVATSIPKSMPTPTSCSGDPFSEFTPGAPLPHPRALTLCVCYDGQSSFRHDGRSGWHENAPWTSGQFWWRSPNRGPFGGRVGEGWAQSGRRRTKVKLGPKVAWHKRNLGRTQPKFSRVR